MKRIILWTLYLSMVMFPFSTADALPLKGDVDNNGNIALQDAIMAIRITSGMDAGAEVFTSADAGGDNKLGTDEAIYILQCISGLRSACDVPPADTQLPSVPTNLQAAASTSQIDLTWGASTDNVGVTGYEVYRGETKVGTSATPSYSDAGLTASTHYCYTVLAYDGAMNKSGRSAQSCATTQDATIAKIALDTAGTVQTTVTVAGPGGSRLTLYAGTRIALIGEGGAIQPPVSLDNVYLSLANASGSLPSLPGGVTGLAQIRIVLTVDGVESDAWFWPASAGGGAEQGLKLVVAVTDQSMNNGTLGMLFDMASGNAIRVASSALTSGGGGSGGGGGGSGSTQMQFSPSSTGSYAAGGSEPGSGSAPGGTFWSSFTVPDPGCITVETVEVCGPSRVDRVEIIEESTAEILGLCNFGESNTATTGSLPPGYQFWCERSQNASGGSTDIKVSSMQSNLPQIHNYLVRASDGLPMWQTYAPATGGLNGPDGAVYSDPYQKKEFEFAGYKKLTFTTKEDKDYNWMREHTLQPLRDAGYTVNLHNFSRTSPGFIAEMGVYDTLDARVLMEENVILKQKGWKVVGDDTRGNRGSYEYKIKYQGTAKATMYFPTTTNKVWEITADVTFEKDPNTSGADGDTYNTSEGTITQTMFTVPDPSGQCAGNPASFTNTYPIFPGDGSLRIVPKDQAIEYRAGASISASTPLEAHNYQRCCSYTDPPCENKTMQINEQEHEWLRMGANMPGMPGGVLQGTYQTPPFGTPSFEWMFTPVE
jgi:chitodextrinase